MLTYAISSKPGAMNGHTGTLSIVVAVAAIRIAGIRTILA
jgi:hypothetical protein